MGEYRLRSEDRSRTAHREAPHGVTQLTIIPKIDREILLFWSAPINAIIVGTGGHFLIRLASQNEWDGQRDRGAEDGTIVKGL